MIGARIFLGFFALFSSLALFIGYFHINLSIVISRLGLAELCVSIFVIFSTLFIKNKYQLDLKTATLPFVLVSIAIVALILPYIIKPQHFFGDDYRLLSTLVIIFIFIPLSKTLEAYGTWFSGKLILMMVGIAIAYSFVFFVMARSGLHVSPFKNNFNYTFPGFHSIRHLGYLFAPLMAMAVVILSSMQKNNHSAQYWYFVLGVPVLWSLLLWSGSRASMLSISLSFVVLLSLSSFSRSKIGKTILWTLPVGIAMSSLYPIEGFAFGFWASIFFNQDFSSLNGFSSGRIDIWILALENIRENPFLGHGMGSFRTYILQIRPTTDVSQIHNGYLEYLHAGGVFAFVGIFTPISLFYYKLCQCVKTSQDWIFLAVFAAITVTLISAFLNGVLYHYRPILQTVILFAIANYHLKLEQFKPIKP